mmetsp:Transcript_17206/g.49776  ORF Transcript_17206/g.49776 Transcript_17206/m.49776 type:complete len:327 (-) Transcript_17206:76-1056(-)
MLMRSHTMRFALFGCTMYQRRRGGGPTGKTIELGAESRLPTPPLLLEKLTFLSTPLEKSCRHHSRNPKRDSDCAGCASKMFADVSMAPSESHPAMSAPSNCCTLPGSSRVSSVTSCISDMAEPAGGDSSPVIDWLVPWFDVCRLTRPILEVMRFKLTPLRLTGASGTGESWLEDTEPSVQRRWMPRTSSNSGLGLAQPFGGDMWPSRSCRNAALSSRSWTRSSSRRAWRKALLIAPFECSFLLFCSSPKHLAERLPRYGAEYVRELLSRINVSVDALETGNAIDGERPPTAPPGRAATPRPRELTWRGGCRSRRDPQRSSARAQPS